MEDRQKAALAIQEAKSSEIAKSEALAAEQSRKHEDLKTQFTSSTPNTQQANLPESQQKEAPPTMPKFPCKLSGPPVTNLQIKIQPEKQPEIVCKNFASTIPPTTNQQNSKVGNSVAPSTTSATNTASLSSTAGRPSDVNILSIPSKTHDKPADNVVPQKPIKPSNSMKSTGKPGIGSVTDPNPPLASANNASAPQESELLSSSCAKPTSMLVDTPESSVSSKEPVISEVSKSSIESENVNTSDIGGSITNLELSRPD